MICRKKTLLLCLSALLCSLFFSSSPVSAFNLTTVGGGTFATGTNQSYFSIYYNPTDGRKNFSFGTDQGGTITGRAIGDSQVPAGGKLDYIWLRSDRLPASALVSFDVRFNMPGASTTAFTGFEINDYATILSQQCKDNGTGMPNASVTATKDWTCHFLVYTGTDFYPSYGIQINARILDVAAGEGVVIMVSPFSYARVTSESGGSVDVSDIEDLLQDILDQLEDNNYATSLANISTVLNQIKNNQPSADDIAQAISDAEEAEMLDAQDEAQDDSDDSQTAVQGATTSLLSVLGQFVTALTTANATNCIIDGDLVPHLPLGQLDLCANSPPAALTALGSLILIAFIIPLAYSTVKRIISLIGEFQR